MTEKKEDKKANPGRIIPERQYAAVSGSVLISMEKIIDSYYEKAEKTYYECKGAEQCRNHVFPHMTRVHRFLEELKHCDEPLDPYVEENDAGAGSSA